MSITQRNETSIKPELKSTVIRWVAFILAALLVHEMLYETGAMLLRANAVPDSLAYWDAGERMAHGDPLYGTTQYRNARVTIAYVYPPTFAALFAPITYLSLPRGLFMWQMVQVLSLVLLVKLFFQLCRQKPNWAGFSMLVAVCMIPLISNFNESQVNLPLMVLLGYGMLSLESGNFKKAGWLFALAVHIKVLPIIFIPLLLVSGRRQVVKHMIAAGLILCLVPLVWSIGNHGLLNGIQGTLFDYRDWVLDVILKTFSTDKVGGFDQYYAPNTSWASVMHRWFDDGIRVTPDGSIMAPLLTSLSGTTVKLLSYFVPVTMLGLSFALAYRKRKQSMTGPLVITFIAFQSFYMLVWQHHLVSLALLLALVYRYKSEMYLWAMAPVVALWSAPTIASHLLEGTKIVIITDFIGWANNWGVPTFAVLFAWAMVFRLSWTSDCADTTVSGPEVVQEDQAKLVNE